MGEKVEVKGQNKALAFTKKVGRVSWLLMLVSLATAVVWSFGRSDDSWGIAYCILFLTIGYTMRKP